MNNLPVPIKGRPLRVVACLHPFKQAHAEIVLNSGPSLWEFLQEVQPDISRYAAHVWVDDDYVPPELWASTYPAPGSDITVRVIPRGGVGRIIASIFIAVAAIAAAFVAPWLFGLTGPMAGIVGGLAGLTVGVVGNLALNALFPPTLNPPRQLELSGTGFGQIQDSPTYSLRGGSNQANKFGPIPKILGRHKFFPLYGAEPYTEIIGEDQYLRLLFVWGISRAGTPAVQIEDLKIGDTPVGNYEGIELEHRNLRYKAPDGSLTDYGDEPLTLYTNDIHEEPLSILLEHNQPQIRTVAAGAREISLDVIWPSGLYATDSVIGNRENMTCEILVEYRRSGSADPWTGLYNDYQTWIDTSYVWTFGMPVPPGWTPYFTSLKDPQGVIHASGSIIVTGGYYTGATAISIRAIACTNSAVRRGLRWLVPEPESAYDVRLTRLTPPDSSLTMSQAYWNALRSIRYTTPFQPPVPCAVTVMRIKASNELNGTVNEFSGVVSGIMPDWDQGTETWITRISQNPASHLRELLQGPQNMDPYLDSEVDLIKLEYFHAYCVAQGWQYNKIIDYDVDLDEIYGEIAAAGRAATDWLDSKRGVIIDEPQAFSIGPAFTPRNSKNFSSQITYPEEVHCWRCTFKNELNGWADDERLVLLDGYALLDPDGNKVDAWGDPAPTLPLATKFVSLPLLGITHPELIFKHARFHGAQLALRYQKHDFEAGLDQLVARRGNRFKFAHDVILVGSAWGRVRGLIRDEIGYLAGVQVDADCSMLAGKTYCLRFRLADNVSVLCNVNTVAGTGKELTLTEPIPPYDPGPPPANYWPDIGDLFMFGETGKETIDLLLYAVRPNNNLGARITAVEYDENIYLADQGVVPPHDPKITLPAAWQTPVMVWVRSGGDVLWQDNDGSWKSRILINLGIPGALEPDITGIEAQYWLYNSNAQPITLPVTPVHDWEVSLMPVEDGLAYSFRLRYAKLNGLRGPWTATITHLVEGKTAPPSDVEGLNVRQVQEVVTISWYDIPDKDRAGFEIRYGTYGVAWDGATIVNGEYKGTTFTTTDIPPGSWDILIKAKDTSGNYSVNASRKSVVIYQFYEILSQVEQAPLWAGTLSNCHRNPQTNNVNPSMQAAVIDDYFDILFAYCHNPYTSYSYEAPEVDLGEDKTVRTWAMTISNLAPGESGTILPQLAVDYKMDGGAYDGFEDWTVGYLEGRYVKHKITHQSANGLRRIVGFQPTIDQMV